LTGVNYNWFLSRRL